MWLSLFLLSTAPGVAPPSRRVKTYINSPPRSMMMHARMLHAQGSNFWPAAAAAAVVQDPKPRVNPPPPSGFPKEASLSRTGASLPCPQPGLAACRPRRRLRRTVAAAAAAVSQRGARASRCSSWRSRSSKGGMYVGEVDVRVCCVFVSYVCMHAAAVCGLPAWPGVAVRFLPA